MTEASKPRLLPLAKRSPLTPSKCVVPTPDVEFALQVLHRLDGVSSGIKDNQFYAGRLVLGPDKSGQNWAWSMTPHYPVVDKIPADIDYVVAAYAASEKIVERWTLSGRPFS